MWNDLQIEQWADDDHMRKTRVQNDQFWDHLHDNVDDYVKRKGKKKALEKNQDTSQNELDASPDYIKQSNSRNAHHSVSPDGESKLSKHKHTSRLSQNRSNNKQQKSSKQRKTSVPGTTAEVQINVNGENMLVTLENLERTIPKPPKKAGMSKQRQKQEMIAQAK